MQTKLLTQMLEQYRERNNRLPQEIQVHPVALLALTAKQEIAPQWNGIPVKVREVAPAGELEKPARFLGITVIDGALRCFDL